MKKKHDFQHFSEEEKDVIQHFRTFSSQELEAQLADALAAQDHPKAQRDIRLIQYIKKNPVKPVDHISMDAGPPEPMMHVSPSIPQIPAPKPMMPEPLPAAVIPQQIPDEKAEEKVPVPVADPLPQVLPVPHVGPGAVPGDVATRTAEAWDNFEARPDHSRAMRDLIHAGLHKEFHFVNPLTYDIEHRERRTIRFQKRDVHSRIEEIHELRHHPMRRILEDTRLEKLSVLRDSTHALAGISADLGRFISMKSLPSATDICIKRGVQRHALRILAQRILEQHGENPTRILLKRTKKGKYIYTEIISRKALSSMTLEQLASKIINLVASRKNYTHLIVRPVYRGGRIHDRIKSNFTLL